MQGMNLIQKILILLFGVAISLQAVPPVLNYAGQVAVNGEAFNGNGFSVRLGQCRWHNHLLEQ